MGRPAAFSLPGSAVAGAGCRLETELAANGFAIDCASATTRTADFGWLVDVADCCAGSGSTADSSSNRAATICFFAGASVVGASADFAGIPLRSGVFEVEVGISCRALLGVGEYGSGVYGRTATGGASVFVTAAAP